MKTLDYAALSEVIVIVEDGSIKEIYSSNSSLTICVVDINEETNSRTAPRHFFTNLRDITRHLHRVY